MYQHTVIVGNVGGDPALRYLADGTAVTDFSVAVGARWSDRVTGETRERTTWFRVTCWGRLAEIANEYVRKGRQVLVAGDVEASAWTDKEGNARATLDLTARELRLLGRWYANTTDPYAAIAAAEAAGIKF